jgi:hypothetical protein
MSYIKYKRISDGLETKVPIRDTKTPSRNESQSKLPTKRDADTQMYRAGFVRLKDWEAARAKIIKKNITAGLAKLSVATVFK